MSQQSNHKTIRDKAVFIAKLCILVVSYFIITEFLTTITPEILGLQHFSYGFIGIAIFLFFYIVEFPQGLIFRFNKFHIAMILFSLEWVFADWQDLMTLLSSIV